MTAERAVMLIKNFFGGNLAIWTVHVSEKVLFHCFWVPREINSRFCSKTDVSVGFLTPCWCPSVWTQAWHRHTNLFKFGYHISSHILLKKNCCNLNPGESLCIFTFFLFPDSGLNLWNGFDFRFDLFWMAGHWKLAMKVSVNIDISFLTHSGPLHMARLPDRFCYLFIWEILAWSTGMNVTRK